MDLHFFKDISQDSKEIQEFISILHHTFYIQLDCTKELNNSSSSESDYSGKIDEIFEKLHSLCKPLFHNSFRFFGISSSDQNIPYSTFIPYYPDFWINSIKYHCVISSLYTLLYAQLYNTTLSSYRIINDIKGSGYFSLIDKHIISVQQDGTISVLRANTNDSAERSKKSSHYSHSHKSFYNHLDNREQKVLGMSLNNKGVRTSLLNSDLIFQLEELHKNGGNCKKFHQFYINSHMNFSCNDYFNAAHELQKLINPQKEENNPVDQILLQYKAERFYNFSLTYCVIKSLLDFSHQHNNILNFDSFPLEILELIFRLPNTFSRNVFFVYALESFLNDSLSDSIFNARHRDVGAMAPLKNDIPQKMRLINWLPLLQKFVLFFATLIFPLYERCFFLLLKSVLCNHNTQDIIFLLRDYIEEHAQDIYRINVKNTDTQEELPNLVNQEITPIEFNNKMEEETVNLITKKILKNQNNIFHAVPYPEFNAKSFGFHSSKNQSYRELMTLLVDSRLNNVLYT